MDTIVLSGLLGLVVPPVVSFLKNAAWPKPVKVAFMVLVSAIAALLSLLQEGKLGDASWKQIVANLAVVVTVAQVFYHTYFADTAANVKLENVKVLP